MQRHFDGGGSGDRHISIIRHPLAGKRQINFVAVRVHREFHRRTGDDECRDILTVQVTQPAQKKIRIWIVLPMNLMLPLVNLQIHGLPFQPTGASGSMNRSTLIAALCREMTSLLSTSSLLLQKQSASIPSS